MSQNPTRNSCTFLTSGWKPQSQIWRGITFFFFGIIFINFRPNTLANYSIISPENTVGISIYGIEACSWKKIGKIFRGGEKKEHFSLHPEEEGAREEQRPPPHLVLYTLKKKGDRSKDRFPQLHASHTEEGAERERAKRATPFSPPRPLYPEEEEAREKRPSPHLVLYTLKKKKRERSNDLCPQLHASHAEEGAETERKRARGATSFSSPCSLHPEEEGTEEV